MKTTARGLRPNLFVTLHSSLLLVAMLFMFVSCGSDDDNNPVNPWGMTGPQTCFNPQTNAQYTCYPGDPYYPGGFQNPGQYPGFPNGQTMTFEQLKATFVNMAMNTNTPIESSILLNTSFFGSEVQVVKSVDANQASIEVVDGNGYDIIDSFTLTKQEVLENIFGEQQSYTSNYQVFPIQICTQSRIINGFEIIEYYTNYSGFFQASSIKSRVVVSTEVPLFANPLESQGVNENRTVLSLNRETISLNCGFQGGFQPYYGF